MDFFAGAWTFLQGLCGEFAGAFIVSPGNALGVFLPPAGMALGV
jgi:hypothetical protein